MSLFLFLRKSLAAKLMLTFVLVAVLPMLAASYMASRLVNDLANANIGHWLRTASQYLLRSISDKEEALAAAYTVLHAHLAQRQLVFSPEDLQALSRLNVDCIVLHDESGSALFASPRAQSLDAAPLYPGSPFRWMTMKNGKKELAVVARQRIELEDGSGRLLELAGLFSPRFPDSEGHEPITLRIYVPDGNGFRQEYDSSTPPELRVLPLDAVQALQAGVNEYSLFDADWLDDTPDEYFLFIPARSDQGELLAVFAIAAPVFPHRGYAALFVSFFAGGTLLSCGVGYALARTFTRPIQQLAAGARSIAAGDFSRRITVRGKDEVAALTVDFNQMAEQLELLRRESIQSAKRERSRMLGEVALGFAHEIRNPLLVIKTSAELVHGKLPGNDKGARLLGFVIDEVGRIEHLISEFLSFAKPAPLVLSHFRLGPLVNEVLELTAAECAARDVACSFVDEAGQSASVFGAADKIRQVLLNLMINSLDAMPQGGSLTIRAYAPDGQAHVCFEVKDTGVGIPEYLLPTIHLPFVSTKKNGLGLGLATTYAIVEEHGGSIACASTPGQGTVFTVCLKS